MSRSHRSSAYSDQYVTFLEHVMCTYESPMISTIFGYSGTLEIFASAATDTPANWIVLVVSKFLLSREPGNVSIGPVRNCQG